MHVDALDVAILRAMGVRPYGAFARGTEVWRPARLAEHVGVTEDTVRSRIARMEESGLIAGYRVAPNLPQMGLTGTGYYFEPVGGEAARVAHAVINAGIPGVMEVHAFLGRGLCVELASPDDAEAKRRLAAVAGVAGASEPIRFHEWSFPRVRGRLSPLDWRIVRAMRANGRRPLPEVADELGVSARTVKRRFERMAEQGSVFCVPLVDLSKAAGILLVELLVHLRPGAPDVVLDEVVADLAGNVLHVGRPIDPAMGNGDIILSAESPARVESLRERVASRPGVARADAMLVTAIEERATWMDETLRGLAGG